MKCQVFKWKDYFLLLLFSKWIVNASGDGSITSASMLSLLHCPRLSTLIGGSWRVPLLPRLFQSSVIPRLSFTDPQRSRWKPIRGPESRQQSRNPDYNLKHGCPWEFPSDGAILPDNCIFSPPLRYFHPSSAWPSFPTRRILRSIPKVMKFD